jgi:membrane dipeptidase
MIARTADQIGVDHIGIGTDLCQDHPDSVVEWMRSGRWTKKVDFGEGSADAPGFPPMPDWFHDNRDFGNIASGLRARGMSDAEVSAVMGDNWLRFFNLSFSSRGTSS